MKKCLSVLICLVMFLSFASCSAQRDEGAENIKSFIEALYNVDLAELLNMEQTDYAGEYYERYTEAGEKYCQSPDYAGKYIAMWLPVWSAAGQNVSVSVSDVTVTKAEDISSGEHTYTAKMNVIFTTENGDKNTVEREGRFGLDDENKIIYVRGLEDDGY